MNDLTATYVVRRLGDLSDARRTVTALLGDAGAETATMEGCLIVMSELVTNAFKHGRTNQVTIDVTCRVDGVVFTFRHIDIEIAPNPADAFMPTPSASRGRGLAIAVVIANALTRHVDSGMTVTVAHFLAG